MGMRLGQPAEWHAGRVGSKLGPWAVRRPECTATAPLAHLLLRHGVSLARQSTVPPACTTRALEGPMQSGLFAQPARFLPLLLQKPGEQSIFRLRVEPWCRTGGDNRTQCGGRHACQYQYAPH